MAYKKFVLRSVLICVFVVSAFIIIVGWSADTRFRNGQKLEAASRLPEALAEYERAVYWDPYNAEYLAGLGNFLYSVNFPREDKSRGLLKAESLYSRAIKLEPRNSRHYLMLGLVEMRLRENDPDLPRMVMRNFQSAHANDPNGFNTSYEIGYAGLSLWKRLDPKEKQFVLDRLRYAIKQHPEFADYIYPRFRGITRDPEILSRLRAELSVSEAKERAVTIAAIKQKNEGLRKIKAFENVSLYWNETVDQPIYIPAAASKLKIVASGTSAHGIYPYMIVEIDGKEIGEIFVDSKEWREYYFNPGSGTGIKVLSLTFANDYQDDKNDRNLFIREAVITDDER